MTRLALLLGLLGLAGCSSNDMHSPRTLTFDFDCDDPAGVLVLNIVDEECATLNENLRVSLKENQLTLDRAYLKNSCLVFEHRGKRIGNGTYTESAVAEGLHYWLIHRDEKTYFYYIGTRDQFANLDRSRPLTVGPRTIQL